MCCWACVQLAAHWSVVSADTADAVLYWLTATCLVWLGMQANAVREDRKKFLQMALSLGSAVCLLGLVQLFTSPGRIFWLFSSGYDSGVAGPFVSRNNYAEFVELLLPVALVMAFRHQQLVNVYWVLAAALMACIFACGSRAGTLIAVSEAAFAFALQMRAGGAHIGRRWIGFLLSWSSHSLRLWATAIFGTGFATVRTLSSSGGNS